MDDRYLTVLQVASAWGVSRSLVYLLVARGLIPSTRFGLGRGTIRIRERDAADYRKKHARDDAAAYAEHFA